MRMLKLICIALILGISSTLFAQIDVLETKISIKVENKTILEILNELTDKYNIALSYTPKIIDNEKKINIEVKEKQLKVFLLELLGEKYEVKTMNNQIIILKKENNLQGKKQTVRGVIVDKDTQMPLVGATVVVKNSDPILGSITDIEGIYVIKNVPVGRQGFIISYIGYKQKSFDNIMLLSAKEKILNIELEESVLYIEEVVVSAFKGKSEALNEMAAVGARSFTVEETEKYAGSWGDPARMATNFAGVVTSGDQRNDIVIRGNSPIGLIWQLEGVPIPSPNHFDILGATGGPVSILNNNLLSRSDFFTGAFPAEYGNGISGVFDLNMRNGNNTKYEFMGQLGFNGFEFGAEGPIFKKSKSSFLINYRYSMLGLIQDLLWVEGLPQYQDISYKLHFPYKKGSVSCFGFGGKSEIGFEENNTTINDNEYHIDEIVGSLTFFSGLKHTHFITNNTRIINTLAYSTRQPFQKHYTNMNGDIIDKISNYKGEVDKKTISSKLISKLNARNTVRMGVKLENVSFYSIDDDSEFYRYDSIVYLPVAEYSKDNLNIINGFLDFKHKFNDQLSVHAGMHFQRFLFNNTQSYEPRIGLKFNYLPKATVSIGYGKHCQMQPLFLYFAKDAAATEALNNKLNFTCSNQYVIGHDYLFNKNLRLKVELYYQQLYDIPVKESIGHFSLSNYGAENMPLRDSLLNEGTGKNYGIDITFEKFLHDGFHYLITASIFSSKYVGADGIERNTVYNGNFVFNALGGQEFKTGKNSYLNFNLRCVYAGGMRYIPIDLARSRQQGSEYYIYDRAYENRVPDYLRIDFRFGYILQKKRVTHEWGFDIVNLTNHSNVFKQEYDASINGLTTEYHQGFFPMGLYRINF